MFKKHFLSITDLNTKQLWQVLLLAKKLKTQPQSSSFKPLEDKNAVLLFEKPSLRTKLSFDIAISSLGGHPIYFGPNEVGTGSREEPSDVAKVISGMADLIIARVYSHEQLEKLAASSQIPVINALSDSEHPCQTLADLLTIFEFKGKLEGLKIAFVGDGDNNVPHSLALACAILGINFSCASPKGYSLEPKIYAKSKLLAQQTGAKISQTIDPLEAVKNADVVYTDTWISMGDEAESEKRLKIFKPYQVNQKLMSHAKKDAIFMHDMPAYRGKEVSEEVIDGPQSVVFAQAENRLHAQRALLAYLFIAKSALKESIGKKEGNDSFFLY